MAIFQDLIRSPVDERKWHDELFDLLESAAKEDADFLALHGINVITSRGEKTVYFTGKQPTEEGEYVSVWIAPEYETGLLMLCQGGSGLIFDCYVEHRKALADVVELVRRTFKLPGTETDNGEV